MIARLWRRRVAGVVVAALSAVLVACSDGPAPIGTPTASSIGTPAATPVETPAPPDADQPRAALAPGEKPGPDNTGVRPGVRLTIVQGDVVVDRPGVVSGREFHGFVRVTGDGVVFRNCVFRGRATERNAALLDTERGTNTIVEDSEFVPAHPSATVDGIWARDTRIYRANIHGSVDGVKAGSEVLIQDSWIHDLSRFAHDPNQGGGSTHNDGVQAFDGDRGVTLRHNTIDLSRDDNAALQSSATDVRVEANWLDGGGCTLNFAHHDGRPLTGISVVDNRFGRGSYYECPILVSTLTTLTENTGNVWDDIGQAIPPPDRHD
jgi:hypothetical protein